MLPRSAALERKKYIFFKVFNWEVFVLFAEQLLYQGHIPWKRVEVNFVYIKNCCRWCLSVLVGPCCLRAGTGCSLFSEVCKVHRKHSSYCFLLGTSLILHTGLPQWAVKGKRSGGCRAASFLHLRAGRGDVLCWAACWQSRSTSCPKPARSQLQGSLILSALRVCAQPQWRIWGWPQPPKVLRW